MGKRSITKVVVSHGYLTSSPLGDAAPGEISCNVIKTDSAQQSSMPSIYRIWIRDFGALKQQVGKQYDSILLPVIPRVGDTILYFYLPHPEADETEDIDLKVTSVKLLCQPDSDKFNIPLGQESKFCDDEVSYHAEIAVDRAN